MRRQEGLAKMGFPVQDYDLRDTIEKVRRRLFLYRTTESVKRQPVMNFKLQRRL